MSSPIYIFPGSFKPPHRGHFQIVSNILEHNPQAILYIIISKKPRYTPFSNIPIPASFSLQLWKTWIQHMYPQSNIHVSIAHFPSPILDTGSKVRTLLKQASKAPIYLVKSDKGTNKNDTRFQSILSMSPRCKEYIGKTTYMIHSSSIRERLESLTSCTIKAIQTILHDVYDPSYAHTLWPIYVSYCSIIHKQIIKKSKKG